MLIDRRDFGRLGLGSLAFAGLAGAAQSDSGYVNQARGYGPLRADRSGLLDLPDRFSYRVISSAGERMDDGFVTPDKFDGMGCFALGANRVALVRNHELGPNDRALGPTGGLERLERAILAKPFFGADSEGRPLPGGTSTIVYDLARGRRESVHLSLSGTAVNCAGGPTPWGSWLSCEETSIKAPAVARAHGWVFEVPANARAAVAPVPLTALGRFRHEAAAVDPRTGIVYLTEDREDSLFYRFLPRRGGALARGGRLQALAFADAPADTRNWSGVSFPMGASRAARWIDLEGIDSPEDDLRKRGAAAGAAIFARGEGIHRGSGEFYFTCTSGGAAKIGQIMRYRPSPAEGRPGEAKAPATLQNFVESSSSEVLDYGDNITVAPWGHLIVCEDRSGSARNYLRGISPEGRVYTIARLLADTELAGACFAPDGKTLFLNVYRPGKTLAISGPWSSVRT
jgi:secreted PhoX family phosphatase